MVLGTFKPAHPCGESGLGASTGTMGLSWVRMQLSGLLWCWHNGHVPLLWERQKPCHSPECCSLRRCMGDKGCWKGRKPSPCVTGKRDLDHEPPTCFAPCML